MATVKLPFTLFVTSDLHLEISSFKDRFHTAREPTWKRVFDEMPPADVCVLAGDIGEVHEPYMIHFLKACAQKYDLVLLVPGNHDFWAASDEEMRGVASDLGIVYLNGQSVTYRGVRFIGTTLWTELGDDDRAAACEINDFRHIRDFNFEEWQLRHQKARAFLASELKKSVDLPTVVITHHAPSTKCIPPKFQNDASNSFYASNLHAWMTGPFAPDMWICGHTHHPIREQIGGTLLMSNPRFDVNYEPHDDWNQVQES